MSTKVSEFKNYIRGLIQQELKELEEASVTGALDGGEGPPRTPYAFSGGRKKDKDKKKKITQAAGYTKVHEGQKREASNIMRKYDLAFLKFSREIRDVIKMVDRSTGSKVDGKIIEKAYEKGLIPLNKIMIEWEKGQQQNPGLSESVNEGKYHDYRNDESMTPKQKIGSSMREVKNSLNELSKLIDMNVKLKNELNVNSQSYWKNTHKALNKIGERLVKLANKVGQLQ